MCRLLGYCSSDNASVADLLGPGFEDFTALSAAHADGWGKAALDDSELKLERSPRQASTDPEYRSLAAKNLGDIGLVHLRWATPGLPIEQRNSHPFRNRDFVLAHNGAIRPQDKLPAMLPPEWEAQVTGTTDSERYFLSIMSRIGPREGGVVAAIADAVAHIRQEFQPNCLNAILFSPETLYAVCWFNPELIPYEYLRDRAPKMPEADVAGYFNLACQVTGDAVVVASTGWPQPGWQVMPNGSVLTVDRATRAVSLTSL